MSENETKLGEHPLERELDVSNPMIHFILPSLCWLEKHGNVYCSHCHDKTKKAMIPTSKKSIVFRKSYASCEDCIVFVSKKIFLDNKINEKEEYSDAAYSIGFIYG